MSEAINSIGMDQADYLKIFMQELNYQDPLKPVDNKEFMAQMAQFSALQQAKESNENLARLMGMTAASQAVSLLGRNISFSNGNGNVRSIKFENQLPKLVVSSSFNEGESFTIGLGEVTSVNS